MIPANSNWIAWIDRRTGSLRSDAPEHIKQAYEEHRAQQERLRKAFLDDIEE